MVNVIDQVTPPPVAVNLATPYGFRVNRWASLASRIKARDKALTVQTLYQLGTIAVGPAIVGFRGIKNTATNEALPNIGQKVVPPNLSEAADILSQAVKGSFPYLFRAGKRVFDDIHYPEAIKIEHYHYNLPFFFGLSFSVNGRDWELLVPLIGEKNSELGAVLANIGKEIATVEKKLAPRALQIEAQLLEQKQRGQPVPQPPVPPRPPGPPPIPGKHDPDKTVRNKQR